MALSSRWRGVWAATQLLVDDAHLRGAGGYREISVVRAISRCVAAHPGPVRSVHVTRVSFHEQEYALQCLVACLAAKKVQDLILFNRPWPLDMPLPDDILSCTSLSRLYLGVWRFPDTAACPPAFPNLRELGLFHTILEDRDFDALLAHCPNLEILFLAMAYHCPSRLHITWWSGYLASKKLSLTMLPAWSAWSSTPFPTSGPSRLSMRPGWRCSASWISSSMCSRLAALLSRLGCM